MKLNKRYLVFGALAVLLTFVLLMVEQDWEAGTPNLYAGQAGDSLAGLSAHQKEIFASGKRMFEHDFDLDEGLGPLYNGRSCYQCHGAPGTPGAAGTDSPDSCLTVIGRITPGHALESEAARSPDSVREKIASESYDGLVRDGGPIVQSRSVTGDFPDMFAADCRVAPGAVPATARFVSRRCPGALFGAGLIDAIPERTIFANMMRQAARFPDLVGRTNPLTDPLTRTTKVGRFGAKDGEPDLLNATANQLNSALGVTTYVNGTIGGGNRAGGLPGCLREYLPGDPNDRGEKLVAIADFQALLAPPPEPKLSERARRGERYFNKVRCAVCHTPSMDTAPMVEIANPASRFPKLDYIEVRSLENQPVRLYSDLLLHQMGPALADGIAVFTAAGGEWRTTPLWGIRYKRWYLHDGRANSIEEAILAHGGQAKSVVAAYRALPAEDRQALLEFVGSL